MAEFVWFVCVKGWVWKIKRMCKIKFVCTMYCVMWVRFSMSVYGAVVGSWNIFYVHNECECFSLWDENLMLV